MLLLQGAYPTPSRLKEFHSFPSFPYSSLVLTTAKNRIVMLVQSLIFHPFTPIGSPNLDRGQSDIDSDSENLTCRCTMNSVQYSHLVRLLHTWVCTDMNVRIMISPYWKVWKIDADPDTYVSRHLFITQDIYPFSEVFSNPIILIFASGVFPFCITEFIWLIY